MNVEEYLRLVHEVPTGRSVTIPASPHIRPRGDDDSSDEESEHLRIRRLKCHLCSNHFHPKYSSHSDDATFDDDRSRHMTCICLLFSKQVRYCWQYLYITW